MISGKCKGDAIFNLSASRAIMDVPSDHAGVETTAEGRARVDKKEPEHG